MDIDQKIYQFKQLYGKNRNFKKERHLMQSIGYALENREGQGFHFVDIGANHGFYTHYVHFLTDKAYTQSFEPEPHLYDEIASLVRDNGWHGDVYPVGLWSHAETIPFYHRETAYHNESPSDEASGFVEHPLDGIEPTGNLQVYPLSDYAGIKPVDFVKVDVEGAEHHVLLGMEKYLRLHRYKNVFVEVHGRMCSLYDVVDLLMSCGYVLCGKRGEHQISLDAHKLFIYASLSDGLSSYLRSQS